MAFLILLEILQGSLVKYLKSTAKKGVCGLPISHRFAQANCLALSCRTLYVWLLTWRSMQQGKNGQQNWMDAHALLLPIFSGVNKDAPSRLVRVDSKVAIHSPTESSPFFWAL